MKNKNYFKTLESRSPIIWGLLLGIFLTSPTFAASGLEGRIVETINDLTTVVNVIIGGFIVWAGFLIAKGEGSGMTRLIYGVIGLVVVNASSAIVNYFN